MKLREGTRYEIATLLCIGWDNPDGWNIDGYNAWCYFEPDGTYHGPDLLRVEPIFEHLPGNLPVRFTPTA